MSDTSAAGLQAVSGAFIGLTVIFGGLRFYARKKLMVPYKADDWCMLVAILAFIAAAACNLVLVNIGWEGFGQYPFPMSELPDKFAHAYKIIFAFDSTTVVALGLTKASALLFYRRVFCVANTAKGVLNTVVIATLVVIACWVVTFIFLSVFQCHGHFSKLFILTEYEKHCTLSLDYLYSLYVSDVILDIWVICMPIPSILSLHMTPGRKVGFVGIFMLAAVGLAASIVRLVNFLRIEIFGFDKLVAEHPEDPATKFNFYQILELGMTIVAINIPIVWAIFSRLAPDAVLKVVRSMTSLTSRVSGTSVTSANKKGTGPRSGSDTSSVSAIYIGGNGSSEAHAMHDLKMSPASPMRTANDSDIVVNNMVQVSSRDRTIEEV